jgi:peptide deformylase
VTVLTIYRYPHPVLREPCLPVTVFDAALERLAADMLDTMYARYGSVGLAAPQVGHPLRLIVVDVTATTTRAEAKVLVNPVITAASRNKLVREGCLSFPDYLANVKRATRVNVEAFTINGEPVSYEVKHLEAVCIQHELDHLNGVLMIDRIASIKTDWIKRQARPDASPDVETSTTGDDDEATTVNCQAPSVVSGV